MKNYREVARLLLRTGYTLQSAGVTAGKFHPAVTDRQRRFLVAGNGDNAFFYPAQDAIEEFETRIGGLDALATVVDLKLSELSDD